MARVILLIAALTAIALAQAPRTKNIILITADGLRWQELLNGIDPILMNEKAAGMDKSAATRDRFQRSTPKASREALLPFFWKHIVEKGVVLTDVRVTNSYRVSYPGYSEILTGRAQDSQIKGNDKIQNPSETVLEFLKKRLKLSPEQVALFASWETFRWIGESKPRGITINAGFQDWDSRVRTPRLAELSRIQFELPTPWDGARHDHITFEMALEYLRAAKPRILYLALDETDDWAHSKRYDRVLETIALTDKWIERLWQAVESMPEYRNSTTIIVTSDHGRGSTLEDWHSHGAKVAGAERIWAAFMGPDTPARGEVATRASQRDIAATMIKLLGLEPHEYGSGGTPIAVAFRE